MLKLSQDEGRQILMLGAAQAACAPWPLVSSEHDDTNRSRMVGTSESTVHRAGLRVMMYPARMKWLYTMNCSMLMPHLPCRVMPIHAVQSILTLPYALALRAREMRALLPYHALLCKIMSLKSDAEADSSPSLPAWAACVQAAVLCQLAPVVTRQQRAIPVQ